MLCSIRMFIIWIVTVNTRTKLSHHLLRSCTSYRRWEAITSSWQMSQVSGKTNIYSIQLYVFYFKQVLVNIKVVRGLLIISGPHLLWSYCACICYLIRICDLLSVLDVKLPPPSSSSFFTPRLTMLWVRFAYICELSCIFSFDAIILCVRFVGLHRKALVPNYSLYVGTVIIFHMTTVEVSQFFPEAICCTESSFSGCGRNKSYFVVHDY